MMDTNEHVLDDPFTRRLWEELDLEEISHQAWRGIPPNTHISGSKLINGGHHEVWKLEAIRFYPSPKVLTIIR